MVRLAESLLTFSGNQRSDAAKLRVVQILTKYDLTQSEEEESTMRKILTGVCAAATLLISPIILADARVAVLHLAPFAENIEDTAVDIVINGTPQFEDVTYPQFVDYVDLPAGEYTIDIIPVGATEPAISETFMLMDNVDYSVAAIGNNSTQPLELLALVDDNTPPMMNNVAIRVAHTAPFAATLAATEVSVRTAGGDLVNGLTGVPYKIDSGFFEIAAGTYDLKVASNDGSVNYIDPLPAELPAGANVTLYAIGDGINQPLGILAFPVGELAVRTPVDNSANGWWNILEGSGQGFILQPMPSQNRLVGTWYTYNEDGRPLFLTFDSCQLMDDGMGNSECSNPGGFDGEMATTDLYLNTGGGPSEDDVVTTTKVGEIDFEFVGCLAGMATVRMDGEMDQVYSAANLTAAFCSE